MLGVYSMYWPSSLLSYEMRQELAKGQGGEWYVVLELTLPGGVARYHHKGFGGGGANYDGMLMDLGSLIRTTPDRTGKLESSEIDCTIDDTRNLFAAEIFGSSGRAVRGSGAVLRLASPMVASGSWFVAFSGVVDQYLQDGPNRWKVILRPDDLSLRRNYPKPIITKEDWPDAPTASLAQYGPLLYGRHDATTSTVTGAVPCVYVDDVGFRYLVCWGRAKAITRVYSDGILQTSGFTVTYPTVNGRTCTVIDWTADQVAKAITVDCEGYESVGDGTGVLIENPIDQLKHEISNFILGDFKTGLWLPDSTRIDPASFATAATFFSTFSHVSAKRFLAAKQVTGYAGLGVWSSNWGASLFWKNNGTIGVGVFDYRKLAIYPDATWWLRSDRTPFAAGFRPEWEGLIDRVNVEYFPLAAGGNYIRTLECRDPTSTLPESPEALQLPLSASYD